MLIILSPAKSLNTKMNSVTHNVTAPQFLPEASKLAALMRQYSPSGLASLMKLSDKLSSLNAARFEQWQIDHSSTDLLPAIYAFNGDVYKGLDAQSLERGSLERLGDRARILSGLYGLLRPFDAIRPYRLEMGTKLSGHPFSSLTEFWKTLVTNELNQKLAGEPLLNLASKEYSAAVNFELIETPVISPVFKDFKNGEYKIISFHAKKARGMMARFVIETDARTFDALLAFDRAGYSYSEEYSTPKEPCFIRNPEIH